MKALDESSAAAIEAQLKAAANGDISVEEALAAANAAALAATKPTRGHPWIHPTKGWREHARASKTNRRRKLLPKYRAEAMTVRRPRAAAGFDIETLDI